MQAGWSYGDTFTFSKIENLGYGGLNVIVSVKSNKGVSKGNKTLFMLASDVSISGWYDNINCFCIIWQSVWDVRLDQVDGLSFSGVVKNASLPSIPDPVIPDNTYNGFLKDEKLFSSFTSLVDTVSQSR